jgi:hypothetical protein
MPMRGRMPRGSHQAFANARALASGPSTAGTALYVRAMSALIMGAAAGGKSVTTSLYGGVRSAQPITASADSIVAK